MSTLRGRGLVVLAAIALTAIVTRASDAQDYPARLVTLVVPSPAGSNR